MQFADAQHDPIRRIVKVQVTAVSSRQKSQDPEHITVVPVHLGNVGTIHFAHQPLKETAWGFLYEVGPIFAISVREHNKSEIKTEPNKAMDTTPVAVTVCACAHTVPSTSVSQFVC